MLAWWREGGVGGGDGELVWKCNLFLKGRVVGGCGVRWCMDYYFFGYDIERKEGRYLRSRG